jgi:hypothetical protein
METLKHAQALSESATFYDTLGAAQIVGLSGRTLEGMRVRGGGPAFRRHGGRVRYCLADLLAWSESGRSANTSGAGVSR